MKYKLRENIALRGWKGFPYALRDLCTGQTAPLGEDAFHALSLCNGIMDADGIFIPLHYRRLIQYFAKRQVVIPCSGSTRNTPEQEYYSYPCKYMETAHWSITGKCNMRCRHCYMSAPQAKFGELSHEKCMDIIEQLAAAGIGAVNLTGGEPLIRGDFMELVIALKEKGIAIRQIYTNGMLVSKELLDGLKELGLCPEFSLSFDGVGWHDWMRGIDGAEQMAVDAMRLLAGNGFPVSVESAFHRNSISSIADTMRLLSEIGVCGWKTNPVSRSGNWLGENESLDLTLEELYDAYLELIDTYLREGSPLNIMLGGFFRCGKGKTDYQIPCKKHGSTDEPLCLSARSMMYISPDGRILPCMPLSGLAIQDDMPDLNRVSLIDALSDSVYIKRIETPVCELLAHNEKCRGCEHKNVCGGGCRAAALMENEGSDYLGIDPAACFFFLNGYEERIAQTAEKALKK